MLLLNNIEDWKKSFEGNNNTGVEYEIKTGIYILQNIKNIKGLYNYTQNDNIGGTSDIGILYNNDTLENYSITKYKGNLSKCIKNPSGKIYNTYKTPDTEQKNNESYNLAIHYREQFKGKIPNKKWKRISGGKCPGSKHMCEFLSKIASNNWNNLNNDVKLNRLKSLLDINNKLKPNSNGIIYWNEKKQSIKIFKWILNIKLEEYLNTYNDGIYIYHGSRENNILKTQVKYNNGIIEGMSSNLEPCEWKIQKSSNYLSSWNCTIPNLELIFKLTTIDLNIS